MVFIFITFQANASPCTPPKPVDNYLKAHPRWTMLSVSDIGADQRSLLLAADERSVWSESHKGLCPGLAQVELDGSGKTSYALALIDREKDMEQLVVLMPTGNAYRDTVLEKPFEGIGVVVWSVPPGDTSDSTGRQLHIAHDSIMWERLESASQQIYFSDGQFHRIQLGD
jgi:hypothetical protein